MTGLVRPTFEIDTCSGSEVCRPRILMVSTYTGLDLDKINNRGAGRKCRVANDDACHTGGSERQHYDEQEQACEQHPAMVMACRWSGVARPWLLGCSCLTSPEASSTGEQRCRRELCPDWYRAAGREVPGSSRDPWKSPAASNT